MSVFLRLLALMRPQAGWMALAVLLAALSALAHVALMATAGWFVTAMALAGVAGATMNYFTPSAMIRAFAIVRIAGRYAERVIGHEATLRFVAGLRPWLFARLERSAPANLETLRDGDLLARLRADIDRLEQAFLRVVAPLVAALLVAVPALLWIAAYDGRIAALAAALLGLAGLALPLALQRRSAAAARRLASGTAALNAHLVEEVEGLAELAIYDPDGIHRQRTLAASDALVADENLLARAAALDGAGMLLAAHGQLIAALLLGLSAVAAGTLAPADLPMLALLGLALFDAVGAVPAALRAVPAVLAAATRVFALADRPPAIRDPADPAPLPATTGLVLDKVSFAYPGAPHDTLGGITLTLPPGRRVAVVGPSGSGKSTLALLAMRFVPPRAGGLSLGGVAYERLTGEAVRERIALVGQHDHLFGASIRDNLLVGDPLADEARLREACRIAQILPLIEALPDGLDTFVGAHGAKLSGGEVRRLLVARALVARRPILILDEPTEGLDVATEARLLDALLDEVLPGNVLRGDAKPGGTKPGGSLPGDVRPGDALLGGAQPSGAQPGGTLSGGANPGGSQPGGTLDGDARPEGSGARALLLLTHRPARLARMDEIVRLEAGRVVARREPHGPRSRRAEPAGPTP